MDGRSPSRLVDAYNEELKDKDGFLGDRASKGAFRDTPRQMAKAESPRRVMILSVIRLRIASTKSQLDKYLEGDDPTAIGLIHTAVEEFAGELATVTARFLKVDEWKDTEHIVVGGGLSGSHIGKLAIGRANTHSGRSWFRAGAGQTPWPVEHDTTDGPNRRWLAEN